MLNLYALQSFLLVNGEVVTYSMPQWVWLSRPATIGKTWQAYYKLRWAYYADGALGFTYLRSYHAAKTRIAGELLSSVRFVEHECACNGYSSSQPLPYRGLRRVSVKKRDKLESSMPVPATCCRFSKTWNTKFLLLLYLSKVITLSLRNPLCSQYN